MMYMWILCALTPPTVPVEHHILYTWCTLIQQEGDTGVVVCGPPNKKLTKKKKEKINFLNI